MATQGERIATLEVIASDTSKDIGELKDAIRSNSAKLDELMAVLNKGRGAFWVVSAIVGSGFLGLIVTVISWVKGYG